MFRRLPVSLIALAIGSTLGAQTRGTGADAVFARAQALAGRGNTTAARAMVDSVLVTTPMESAVYPEALFWHATLAASAADAERHYRRLAVEFPLSPRAEDALTRLAQMELARGDRESAARHLDRLLREHPTSAARARTAYWLARVRFEQNDARSGCAALADARTTARADDAELKNQIEYLGRRCSGNEVASGSTPTAPVSSPTDPPPKVPASSATKSPSSHGFTVQVAAYPNRAAADKLVKSLGARGYTARVEGSKAPFRVRVGKFATRDAATAFATRLRRAGIDGIDGMVVGDTP